MRSNLNGSRDDSNGFNKETETSYEANSEDKNNNVMYTRNTLLAKSFVRLDKRKPNANYRPLNVYRRTRHCVFVDRSDRSAGRNIENDERDE